jgi:hypothetical protein
VVDGGQEKLKLKSNAIVNLELCLVIRSHARNPWTLEQGLESTALLSQAWTFRQDLLKVAKALTFQHSIDPAITPKQG